MFHNSERMNDERWESESRLGNGYEVGGYLSLNGPVIQYKKGA